MFPTNVVNVLVENLPRLSEIQVAYARSWRPTDPAKQATVQASIRRPSDYAVGERNPCVYEFLVNIQLFIKATEETYGNQLSYSLAEELWVMLHSDGNLKSELDALQVPASHNPNFMQKVSRFKIIDQRFFDDEAEGEFAYLSNTTVEFQITT